MTYFRQSKLITEATIDISSDEDEKQTISQMFAQKINLFDFPKTANTCPLLSSMPIDLENSLNDIDEVKVNLNPTRNGNSIDDDVEILDSDNDSTSSRETVVIPDFFKEIESKPTMQQSEIEELAHLDEQTEDEDNFNSHSPNTVSDHSEVSNKIGNLSKNCVLETPRATHEHFSSISNAKEFLLSLQRDFDNRGSRKKESCQPILSSSMLSFEQRDRSRSPIDKAANKFEENSEDAIIPEFSEQNQSTPSTDNHLNLLLSNVQHPNASRQQASRSKQSTHDSSIVHQRILDSTQTSNLQIIEKIKIEANGDKIQELTPYISHYCLTDGSSFFNSSSKKVKPWIKDDWSKKIKLRLDTQLALYKCMHFSCVFATNDASKMKEHIDSHLDMIDAMKLKNIDKAEIRMQLDCRKCAYCTELFYNSSTLTEHIQREHSDSIFQCAKCFYRTIQIENLELHNERYHKKDKNRGFLLSSSKRVVNENTMNDVKDRFENSCAQSLLTCGKCSNEKGTVQFRYSAAQRLFSNCIVHSHF